jgi:hypothetical protein
MKVLKVSIALSLVLVAAGASAQTLEVVLVNGKSGRPMVGTSSWVNVWVGAERKEAIVVPTDKDGTAMIRLTTDSTEENIPRSASTGSIVANHPIIKFDEHLRINVPYVMCASGGTNYSWLGIMEFSTTEIFRHGISSPDTCGKASIQARPGQIILFVRPLTRWESFRGE